MGLEHTDTALTQNMLWNGDGSIPVLIIDNRVSSLFSLGADHAQDIWAR